MSLEFCERKENEMFGFQLGDLIIGYAVNVTC